MGLGSPVPIHLLAYVLLSLTSLPAHPPPLQVTQGFADHSDLLAEAKAAKAKVRK